MKKKLILMISIFFIGINYVYANNSDIVKFSKCVDGDTFKILLDEKEYTVRMIAIDTPESVHPTKGVEYYGKEASDYTCSKVTNAKKIELIYDKNSEKIDIYDRLIAWVFIDDKLLQQELIEGGYAKVAYLYDEYQYTNILKEKQELASIQNIGIWNEEAASNYDGNIMELDEKENTNKKAENNFDNLTTKNIIIIIILLLIIIFVGDKTIKNKAKKKLKKILK